MRFGLVLMGQSISDQIALAQRAEAGGFESVWATEFYNHNGFVRVAALAQATQRVKVGTAIAYAFMRAPLLAASAAMDIDEISGGRMILGLGSGTRSMNERWYSVPFDKPPAPRMREAVALIRAAIAAHRGGGLFFEGEFYKVRIPQYSRPGAVRGEVPICIAAVNRGMIRAAAAAADGLIGHPVYTRKYISERVLPELAGSKCELLPFAICSISNDVDQARSEARAQIAFYFTTRLYHTILDSHGWRSVGEEIASAFRSGDSARMAAAVPDELLDAIALTGRPEDVRDQVAQWEGLADHVLLYPPGIGVSPERLRENVEAMVETFGG